MVGLGEVDADLEEEVSTTCYMWLTNNVTVVRMVSEHLSYATCRVVVVCNMVGPGEVDADLAEEVGITCY
jgi:methanogenic corrinoid protein MtbC1